MKTNDKFDETVQDLLKGDMPGAAIAVLRNGEVIHLRAYGLADLEWGIPLRAECSFRIASLTKQFTAAAIMRLVCKGAVSLDDQLEEHLPSFNPRGRKVSLRHLLNHTSGIRNHDQGHVDRTNRPNISRELILNQVMTAPFDSEPGERYAYSNSGYLLLGAVIESASGLDYEAFLKTAFFDPLGMKRTMLCTADAIISLRARGYVGGKNGFLNAPPDPTNWSHAAGGLCSTVDDLFIWDRALRDGSAITHYDFACMIEPTTLTDGSLYPYGFGWGVAEYEGYRLHHHTGGIGGFVCQMARLTDQPLTTIVLSNQNLFPFDRVTRRLLRVALRLPPVRAEGRPATTEDFAPCIGRFCDSHGAEVFSGTKQTHLGLRTLEDGQFFDADDPEVEYRFSGLSDEQYHVFQYLSPLWPTRQLSRCERLNDMQK